MPSEYDPLFRSSPSPIDDLEPVKAQFRAASGPYLRSPWSWWTWALILPATALSTTPIFRRFGPPGVLFAWSAAILLGGAIEIVAIRRSGQGMGSTPLAGWVLRLQGNLSLVALVLSLFLLWQDLAWAIPGVWLLILGHSFYVLGGIAFEPFRPYGVLYQVAGLAALWPNGAPFAVFAAATALGNLWMGYAVWRSRR